MKIVSKRFFQYSSNVILEGDEYYDGYRPLYDRKYEIQLEDGNIVSCALFVVDRDSKKEKSVCVSSQAGCKFACRFCSSGKNGFVRNLSNKEILNQLALVLEDNNLNFFDSIMFMGIGEPLDNLDNIEKSIKIARERKYCTGCIGVATIVLPGKLSKLIQIDHNLEVWISLHAAIDHKRSFLMPINKKSGINELLQFARKYVNKTGRKIWFNYMLFKDFNDQKQDINGLVNILRENKKFCLIVTQPSHSLKDYSTCSKENVNLFACKIRELCPKNEVTTFFPAGRKIGAGCGQFSFTRKLVNNKNKRQR